MTFATERERRPMFRAASRKGGIALFGSGYHLGVSLCVIGRPANETPTMMNYHIGFRIFKAIPTASTRSMTEIFTVGM